ncbi:MAG: translation initiation factor IF-3 [Kiritimatiellia bacterium]
MRSFVRTNLKIRVPKVRCVKPDGSMAGVMATDDARKLAREYGLDLVEISPKADPPVCRIMDFGKYRYDESRKKRQTRKHQHAQTVKEVKFHPNVAENDYQTKLNHVKEFLQKGHKVKITLTFRGREHAHRDLGFKLVNRVLADCEGMCTVNMAPRMAGRSLVAVITGQSGKKKK